MRWPRGRYNGQRIVGVTVKVQLDLTYWRPHWGSALRWECWALGPFMVWLGWNYEQ